MGNLSWSAYSNHPRLLARDTDLTALQTRSNTAAKWQSLWDNTIVPEADTLKALSDSALTSNNDAMHTRFLTLAVVGWVENDASYHTKLLSGAKYLAQSVTWPGFTSKRFPLIALGYAYTYLRSGVTTFSDANRKILGDEIITQSNASGSTAEYMDGHSRGNLMAQLVANIAIVGEVGTGFDYTAQATANIDEALDHWFGASSGAPAALDTERYFSSDGGSGKGAWYNTIAGWHVWNLLLAIKSGLTSTQIQGNDHDVIDDESWIDNVGDWWLYAYDRGDYDYLKMGDTSRIGAPWVHHDARISLSAMAGYARTHQAQIRWLLDRLSNYQLTVEGETPRPRERVYEFLFFDPETVPSTSPDGVVARSRLLNSNDYFYESSWTKDQGAQIHITAHEYYKTNHAHLDVGTIQCAVRGDCVLLNRGYYSASDHNAEPNGTHHRYFNEQTLAHSGIVLIDDGTAEPHRTRLNNNGGDSVRFIAAGKGGQYYREFVHPTKGQIRFPDDATSMRQDGSGDAWRRCGKTGSTDIFRIVEDDTSVNPLAPRFVHLAADLHPAYLRFYSDRDGASDRLVRYDAQWLIIGSGVIWQWPIVFSVHRVEATSASYVKRLIFGFHGSSSSGLGRDSWNIWSTGLDGVGRVNIYVYPYTGFSMARTGTNTSAGSGYFTDQFSYSPGQFNWLPTSGHSGRHTADVGKYRNELRPVVNRVEDYFPFMIAPAEAGQFPPFHTWIDDAEWYGLDFGGGNEFRLHKEQNTTEVKVNGIVISSGGGGGGTPPVAPSGVIATTGPGNGQITVSWNPNTEPDMTGGFYQVTYREKV